MNQSGARVFPPPPEDDCDDGEHTDQGDKPDVSLGDETAHHHRKRQQSRTATGDRRAESDERQAGEDGDVSRPGTRQQPRRAPCQHHARSRHEHEQRSTVRARHDPGQRRDREDVDRDGDAIERRCAVPAGGIERRLNVEIQRSGMIPAEARIRPDQQPAARGELGVQFGDGEIGVGDDGRCAAREADDGEQSQCRQQPETEPAPERVPPVPDE